MEYCRYGSLRDYLVRKRNNFIDAMSDDCVLNYLTSHREDEENGCKRLGINNDTDDDDDDSPLTTKHLVCFSFQIARGMEFLASKRVSISKN